MIPGRRRFLAGLGASALAGPTLLAPTSAAASSPETAGIALGLFASDPDWDYRPLLDEIVTTGARRVLLVVPHYQDSVTAVRIGPRPGYSPARRTVDNTLAAARNRDLAVALMPLVRLTRRTATEWRGVIRPRSVDRWFAAWTDFVADLAGLAAAHRAERLVVGTEFASLEGERARWSGHIAQVRRRFSGKLLYSANWDHHREVPFWDLVDEIGITGYFRLALPGDPVDASRAAARWRELLPRLHAFADGHGKPLVLTEVGWPALVTAASHPWDDTREVRADAALQAALWRGFLDARSDVGRKTSFYAWNWFGVGPPAETGFGLRGQPAARVLTTFFHGARTAPLPG